MAGNCSLTADVGATDVSNSTAGTAVNSSHITQVRVPKRNDGMWIAIASIIGSIIGNELSSGTVDRAEDAENTWLTLTETIKQIGLTEIEHASAIKECDDSLWEKLCAFAMCGYRPDHKGILDRAKADASLAVQGQIGAAYRMGDRFNCGVNADVVQNLRRSEVMAAVGAATIAREEERKNAFSINWNLLAKASGQVETAYLNRMKLGADLIASAGQNYASLAASLRETAKMESKGWSDIVGAIGLIIAGIIGQNTGGCC